ncbi:MAG: hypothetical protein K0R62_8313 [Nonomuraea muscovyensis]|nr:hypothetical protein [Nonomuraea muscovyensis]
MGHLNLVDLRESHLEKLYAAMQQINNLPAGQEPGELLRRLLAARTQATWTRKGEEKPGLWNRRKLTPARIRRIHATISSALGSAHKRKMIEHNPAPHVELPKAPRRPPVVWTAARVEAWRKTGRRPAPVMVWTPQICGDFLDFLEEEKERLYPLYHLVATRGLRRGEVWGLEWTNVDLENKVMALLEGQGDDDDEHGEEVSLKSESSWRSVSLDDENVALLKAWARAAADPASRPAALRGHVHASGEGRQEGGVGNARSPPVLLHAGHLHQCRAGAGRGGCRGDGGDHPTEEEAAQGGAPQEGSVMG